MVSFANASVMTDSVVSVELNHLLLRLFLVRVTYTVAAKHKIQSIHLKSLNTFK